MTSTNTTSTTTTPTTERTAPADAVAIGKQFLDLLHELRPIMTFDERQRMAALLCGIAAQLEGDE